MNCMFIILNGLTMGKFMRKTIVFAFLSGICSILMLVFAQTKDEQKKLPEGRWVLEKVTAFEENVQIIPFNADSLHCCTIPIEINVQKEKIVLTGKDEVKFVASIRGKYVCFPICAEWKIVENKLQLQWKQDLESQELRMMTIVLTYKSK